MEINEQIHCSKEVFSLLSSIATSSNVSKNDLISIVKGRNTILEAISSIFSYIDFVKNGTKSVVLSAKGGKCLEIYLDPSELHIFQAKESIKSSNLDESVLIKDLFLDTKEDSKLERLEYILGEKPKSKCKNNRQEFIF